MVDDVPVAASGPQAVETPIAACGSLADESNVADPANTKRPRDLHSANNDATITFHSMPEPNPANGDSEPRAQPTVLTSQPGTDRAEWLCLECDYSLAHTKEDRCPECGTQFSPAEYKAAFADEPTATYPWEKNDTLRTWASTAGLVLFHSGQFRRMLSISPNGAAALLFSLFTRMIGIFLMIVGWTLAIGLNHRANRDLNGVLLILVMLGAVFAIGSFCFELFLVALLMLLARPRARRNATATWQAVVHYQSAHFVVIAAAVALAVVSRTILANILPENGAGFPPSEDRIAWPVWAIVTMACAAWALRIFLLAIAVTRGGISRVFALVMLTLALLSALWAQVTTTQVVFWLL